MAASGIPTPLLQDHLAHELDVDTHFMDHSQKGMWFYWNHYVECKTAIEKAKEISGAGNWPVDIPAFTEEHVIEVFIGKSAWHNNYGSAFDRVLKYYPDLEAWLQSSGTTQSGH